MANNNKDIKKYLVAYQMYSMPDKSFHIESYLVTASSKSEAVQKVARDRLSIENVTVGAKFKYADVEILAVTEMLPEDEFKTYFCQRDFKDELASSDDNGET